MTRDKGKGKGWAKRAHVHGEGGNRGDCNSDSGGHRKGTVCMFFQLLLQKGGKDDWLTCERGL